MSLKSFINRMVPGERPDPSQPPVTQFGGMDDHEMETVVNGTKPRPRPQRHEGYIAVLGQAPGMILSDGLLLEREPRDADDTQPLHAGALRAFELPTGGHAATNLLYDLETADLILYALNYSQGLAAHHMRWINRLQDRRTPLVVLMNGVTPTNEKFLNNLLSMLRMQITAPVVPVYVQDHGRSRQELMEAVYRLSPRLAALMSIHSPLLRPVLAEYLLTKAVHTSMALEAETGADEDLSSLAEEQVRLIRQITAVYGQGTRLTRREYRGLISMVNAVTKYTGELVDVIPTMKGERRGRLSNSVSTLMVGYITMVYHGETPPEVRQELLPQIWRLYRATGQIADA